MEADHSTDANAQEAPMLSVHGITKKFGDFTANKNIDFDIHPGEIHALLGENGAGKSTLVKMLYGSLQPTHGAICIDGNPVSIASPGKARALGIGMVFQHFSLFEALSVAENIALSLSDDITVPEVARRAAEYSEKYGLPLEPDAVVGDLSVGERQRVEIVRCLLQEPRLLILDEPTSVLTPQEAENLFGTLDQLRSEGRSILFISHRLEEVRTHCDRATILRFGEVITSSDPRNETVASLANMMVGSTVKDVDRTARNASTETLLNIQNLSLSAQTQFSVPLRNINLSVNGGEIVGIAGIAGNGQSELFEAICGERIAGSTANVSISGQYVGRQDINQRRKLGAAFIPEERNGHGAIAAFKLSDNMLLARHASDEKMFQRGGRLRLIWQDMVQSATSRVSEAMDVRKTGVDPYASSLSGGNLQKFIVGRELDRQPSLLVVNQPSWGVDAGAAQRIRQALIDLAASGSAVLVLSQDLDEILEISDRVAVLFEGQLSEPLDAATATREEIGLLMAGIGIEPKKGEVKHVA